MQWPLINPQITQVFGANPNDYKQFGYPAHNGLDLWSANPEIRPVCNQVVISAGWDQYGYGKLVIAQFGGVKFYYAHLDEVLCRPGDELTTDDVLGIMGSTGNSTGPHLHLGFRRGTAGIWKGHFDPLPYLQGILELEFDDRAPIVTPLQPTVTTLAKISGGTLVKTNKRGRQTFKRMKYF